MQFIRQYFVSTYYRIRTEECNLWDQIGYDPWSVKTIMSKEHLIPPNIGTKIFVALKKNISNKKAFFGYIDTHTHTYRNIIKIRDQGHQTFFQKHTSTVWKNVQCNHTVSLIANYAIRCIFLYKASRKNHSLVTPKAEPECRWTMLQVSGQANCHLFHNMMKYTDPWRCWIQIQWI